MSFDLNITTHVPNNTKTVIITQIMKRLVLLLCAIISLSANAQTDFKVVGNKLIWQKVYTSAMTYTDIVNSLQNSGLVTDINFADDVITCKIPETPIDYKNAGYSRGVTPGYIILNDLTAFATIQIKEGRYRVTVENFMLISNMDTALGKAGEKTDIEFYAVKNGELSRQVAKTIDPIIGRQLDMLFSLKEKEALSNDNW